MKNVCKYGEEQENIYSMYKMSDFLFLVAIFLCRNFFFAKTFIVSHTERFAFAK